MRRQVETPVSEGRFEGGKLSMALAVCLSLIWGYGIMQIAHDFFVQSWHLTFVMYLVA